MADKQPQGPPPGGWAAARGWRMPDWVEPILIVSIFLIALWFTRRKQYSILRKSPARYEPLLEDGRLDSPRISDDSFDSPHRTNPFPPKQRTIFGCIRIQTPNSSRFANHVHSRILQKFPFLMEMFYWAITYAFYRMTAVLAQHHYGGMRNLWDIAQEHGLTLLELEARILGRDGIAGSQRWIEWRIEQWFLIGAEVGDWRGIWLTILNRGYALIHIPGTVGFIAYYYAMAPTHARFATVRRTMSLLNGVAFSIFITYPTMPPRLLPIEYGFIDTVNLENAESVWMSGKYVNKLAAMPSMHFGYAFCIGCVFIADSGVLNRLFSRMRSCLMRDDMEKGYSRDQLEVEASQARRSQWKSIGMFLFGVWYPCWILLTIVATANHYFMDAIVASFVVLVGYVCNRVFLVFLPAEDMLLWVLRVEKPIPTTGSKKHNVRSF